ncbi:MAG: hypothetical protein E7208_07200 [Clostridium butyricum]|nr:hypothetical protein [Clostridium butyricum]
MHIQYLILVGVALAMDAFGVTLGIGLNKSLHNKHKIMYILSFSFFQFFFTYLGGSLGYLFDTYITAIPTMIGGIIMIIIGMLMIIDGLKEKGETILIKKSTSLILGISVSIDALVIGFTSFHNLGISLPLFINSFFIGLITMLICTLGFFICRFIRKINCLVKYSNFLGGLALILFGIKMLVF